MSIGPSRGVCDEHRVMRSSRRPQHRPVLRREGHLGQREGATVNEHTPGAVRREGSVRGVVRRRGDQPDRGLPRSAPGVAAAVLGAARDVLPRARGGGRRHDGPGVPRHDRAGRGGHRAGVDGDGDHPVHGQGVRRPPEPGREPGVRGAWRLPVAAGARLHRRAARRGDPRGVVPAGGHRRVGVVRVELPGGELLVDVGVLDGVHLDVGVGERDPRHRVGGAEHRDRRGVRGRRVHRAGRVCGGVRSRAPR